MSEQQKNHDQKILQESLATRKYANPTVDVIFKRVFGTEKNKDCLIGFLSELLGFNIADLSILNPELPNDFPGVKGARLDVLVKLASGQLVNVEIQVANQGNIAGRSLFYWSRIFGEQLKPGESYEVLNPVYGVYILDFEWFEKGNHYLHNFALRNTDTGEKFDEQNEYLHLSFIELPKYKETASLPPKNLDKWVLFFKTHNDQILEQLKMTNTAIAKALSALEIAAMTDEERRLYYARMAALSDEKSLINYNLKKGREEGIEQGKQEGRQEGIEQGKHEGLIETLKKIAKKRFPKLGAASLAKIETLTTPQLEAELEKVIDSASQEEFEKGLGALE